MTETQERWKSIPGFPGYDVSDQGRVRSYWTRKGKPEWHIASNPQRLLNPGINPQGYRFVRLTNGNSRQTTRKVAWFVLRAFVGRRPDRPHIDICHNDGTRLNDSLPNLRYDTRSNNLYDMQEFYGPSGYIRPEEPPLDDKNNPLIDADWRTTE